MILEIVGEEHVLEIDRGLREVELRAVTEAAGERAVGAEQKPAGAAVPAKVLIIEPADGAAQLLAAWETVEAGVPLNGAAWLEAEARILVVELRAALPRRGGFHHRRLDLLDRGL